MAKMRLKPGLYVDGKIVHETPVVERKRTQPRTTSVATETTTKATAVKRKRGTKSRRSRK